MSEEWKCWVCGESANLSDFCPGCEHHVHLACGLELDGEHSVEDHLISESRDVGQA